MPFQAYIDESEGEDIFVIAGLVGQAEQWADFVDRWKAALGRSPAIPRFKFWDAQHRANAFRRFSDSARTDKVLDLVSAMDGCGFTRVSVALDVPAFRQRYGHAWAGVDLEKPYCYAFQILTAAVAYSLLDQHVREQFELFFDEHRILGPRAEKWYPAIRELCVEDRIREMLPPRPIFGTDDSFVHIQAADLYAGLVRSYKGDKDYSSIDATVPAALRAISGLRVTSPQQLRPSATIAAQVWSMFVRERGLRAAAGAFPPIVQRLREDLCEIGGDVDSESLLAPMFEAVDRAAAGFSAELPEGPNSWTDQAFRALDAATRYSPHTQIFRRERLLNRARPVLQGDSEALALRAIAHLGEDNPEAFRSKMAKKRAASLKKAKRRK